MIKAAPWLGNLCSYLAIDCGRLERESNRTNLADLRIISTFNVDVTRL